MDTLTTSFNQDGACISVGNSSGYAIYKCSPFGCCLVDAGGGIGVCEMLFTTSLVALVGAGLKPAFSPRRLRLFNTKTETSICEVTCDSAIRQVCLNRSRLVTILEDKIHIFDLNSMKVLQTLETMPNVKGLAKLSADEKKSILVFPSSKDSGQLLVYDALNLNVLNVINAHKTSLATVALNNDGTLLATASEKGTIVRVFSLPTGRRIASFRRGSTPCALHSLAFSPDSQFVACSGSSSTVHVFQLPSAPPAKKTLISSLLPETVSDYVESSRDFVSARLKNDSVGETQCKLTLVDEQLHLYVLSGHKYFFDFIIDIKKKDCYLSKEHVLIEKCDEMGTEFF
eukprot:TRINITY_DN773992_c0_g1_i1.p1 TRINITY_DN773992_c0_g1~~TRINITY_DN773992_c0_g1_i1.p1  ORF type:complete len:343 (-),score=66.29 TRINITY_DN773992_c0_g1_i1:17-1045(-)